MFQDDEDVYKYYSPFLAIILRHLYGNELTTYYCTKRFEATKKKEDEKMGRVFEKFYKIKTNMGVRPPTNSQSYCTLHFLALSLQESILTNCEYIQMNKMKNVFKARTNIDARFADK